MDEREEIAGIDATLLQSVVSSVSRPLAAGTVRLLYVATASDENIFTALPVSAPDVLLRNVQTKGSMAGVINVGGNQKPLLYTFCFVIQHCVLQHARVGAAYA